MPIASAMTGVLRNHLVLASNAQCPEVQLHMLCGQIVSADLPLLTDGQTHNYNFNTSAGINTGFFHRGRKF